MDARGTRQAVHGALRDMGIDVLSDAGSVTDLRKRLRGWSDVVSIRHAPKEGPGSLAGLLLLNGGSSPSLPCIGAVARPGGRRTVVCGECPAVKWCADDPFSPDNRRCRRRRRQGQIGVRSPRIHSRAGRFGMLCRDAEKMSQTAMNIAAITGPMIKPLRPKIAMPPNVEVSTT
jgi:hypothetical protein